MDSPPNLLALVLDVSTTDWARRGLARTARDKAQAQKGKPSAGPATLDDVVTSALALGAAFSCLNRDNVLVIIAATEEETSVVYPRKGGEGNMEDVITGGGGDGGGGRGERVDLGLLNDYVRLGVAELVNRAAERAERRASEEQSAAENGNGAQSATSKKQGAAIAAALSLALCTINRFMVSCHAGVSALANTSLTQRKDDEGVLALMGSAGVSSLPDRTSDYNALMNCAFSAIKSEVIIDGCFIPSGMKEDGTNSEFLKQLVDQTKGIYLAVPSGAAQVGGALTEVLMSVFLPPPGIRGEMNLPKLHNVDFRARCFETGESIDVAQICNQCLSIFKERPTGACLTCGAKVRLAPARKTAGGGAKKAKLK